MAARFVCVILCSCLNSTECRLAAKNPPVVDFLSTIAYAPSLIGLLSEYAAAGVSDSDVVVPLLRALGNVVTAPTEAHTDEALAAGLLQPLMHYLQFSARSVRIEAAWVLSNVAGVCVC